ncbi:TTAGGG repeat binding factor [Collariella sp. IMI 366227]|nr:TTAGGG repeat binding factor [Collariella sp. IMI 366227]
MKRQKMDQIQSRPLTGFEPQGLDLAAMLDVALADFDQQGTAGDHDTIMRDLDLARPPAPASTTSGSEKAENKIVKASSNPFYVMRSMSLPVLGNIAVQILLRLSQQSRAETEVLLADTDSEFRKAYDMLRDIFRATRKAFSDSPLLSPDELDITDSEDRETIRMSNLAAAGASIFGANEVSLGDLHDAFFSIFVPEDGEYKGSLTELLLCLKTRLLLDALNRPDQAQPVSQLLDTLFPVNFDETLRQRSGDHLLNRDEESLAAQLRERREQLVKSAADERIKKSLEDQSSTDSFAESMSAFLQAHLGIVVDYAERYGVNIPLNEEETTTLRDTNGIQTLEEHDSIASLLQSATMHLDQPQGNAMQAKDALSNGTHVGQLDSLDVDGDNDIRKLLEESLSKHAPEPRESSVDQPAGGELDFDSKNLASFINEKLNSDNLHLADGLPNLSVPGHAANGAGNGTGEQTPKLNKVNMNQQPYQSYNQGAAPAPVIGASGELLPPNQSMPTAALYEKARQAAVAKSSNTQRREGLHSTRRPWSPEEEKALMAGLDMVKGPHWSQILSLFGPTGSISRILKDRTQVQLKDKARNLKLFFLKTNSEMPYYLQSVTGELKTRAPTQAARKEAEEKARMNVEEDKARLNGIMTLAGGFQNNHRPASSPLAATPGLAHSTPAANTCSPSVHTHMTTGAVPQVPISPRVNSANLYRSNNHGSNNSHINTNKHRRNRTARCNNHSINKRRPNSTSRTPNNSNPPHPPNCQPLSLNNRRHSSHTSNNSRNITINSSTCPNKPPSQPTPPHAAHPTQPPLHPDHAQDAKLMETLQAALAASNASETNVSQMLGQALGQSQGQSQGMGQGQGQSPKLGHSQGQNQAPRQSLPQQQLQNQQPQQQQPQHQQPQQHQQQPQQPQQQNPTKAPQAAANSLSNNTSPSLGGGGGSGSAVTPLIAMTALPGMPAVGQVGGGLVVPWDADNYWVIRAGSVGGLVRTLESEGG